ncbi:hypothetical protein DRO69_05620 [Candidatus Bathyarchaeota archaeon]|nr:MAG: hypothetical protein DRO69_05620 [Candidatus Bathyarchaeota archaeon]
MINLDFRMAKPNYADKVLRAIAKEALDFLLKNVNANRIKCILLTGSVANGEGTVIKHNSSVITSDFDFVIYLDFPYYLQNRNHFQHLSQEISTRLINRKVNTHVVFLPSIKILQTGIRFTSSSIYEYEFAIASKCVFGKVQSSNLTARPTKKDALELTFTVVSDLVFSNFKSLSKIEESYIYAKRALTLLNSLLIFHGFFAETYEKRIKIAQKCVRQGILPITKDEVKILEVFTQYKLSGSLQQLLDSLSCNDVSDLLYFQREFLTNLTIKILDHELTILVEEKQAKPNYNKFSQKAKLTKLLGEYSKRSTIQLPSRILGLTLYVFWSFARNKTRKELFATFAFHKQPPKTLLNVLITLLLLHNNTLARKFLEEIFPWMNSDATAGPLQRIFSLWQSAEQSIKL